MKTIYAILLILLSIFAFYLLLFGCVYLVDWMSRREMYVIQGMYDAKMVKILLNCDKDVRCDPVKREVILPGHEDEDIKLLNTWIGTKDTLYAR